MLERSRFSVSALVVILVEALVASSAFAANVSTVAGVGTAGFSGDGSSATAAQINHPRGIAVAADGTIYFADSVNFRVRKIDPAGIITTIVGTGTAGNEGDGGPGTSARIGGVDSIALNPAGTTLYVADIDNDRVRQVDLTTGTISAFAGDGNFNVFGFGDGGPATAAELGGVQAVAAAPDGSVYISCSADCTIRKVDPSGTISTFAGSSFSCSVAPDGVDASAATFASPQRMAVNGSGDLFILDAAAPDVVRRVDHASNAISTVAGGGANTPGFGAATSMDLGQTADVTVDDNGLLYVSNQSQVYKVDLSTGTLSVFAGSGTVGFGGDSGPAIDAAFNDVSGVSIVGDSVWMSDADNNRIRAIIPPPPVPVDLIVDLATSQDLLDSVTALQGSVVMVSVDGRDLLLIPNMTSVGADVTVTGDNQLLVVDLSALESVGGNIDISGNLAMTSLDLSALTTVAGNLNIANDPSLSSVLISGVTSIGGDLTVIGTAATVINLGSVGTVGGNVDISDNTAAGSVNLGSLTSVGGSVDINGNTAATGIDVGLLGSAGGDVSVSGNTSVTTVDLGSLGTSGGDVSITDNTSATSVNLGSLTSSGGSVDVSGNTAATSVNLGSLGSTGGSVDISGNTAVTAVNLGTLGTAGGDVTITDNTAATSVNLGGLGSASNVDITGNTSAGSVNLGNLSTVGGDVTVTDNSASTNVNLGSLDNVGGNVTVDTTGTGAFNLGTGTVGGTVTVTSDGYTSISGTTGGTGTNITATTPEAVMNLQISAASFSTPVDFSLTHLDPSSLVPETGTAADGSTATVDPVTAYTFTFSTTTLNPGETASLSFDVNVGALDPTTHDELLASLGDGTATIVTKGDAAGSTFHAFDLCAAGTGPTVDGCVTVETLDENGLPTTGTPAIVRFHALVSHFSAWGVATVKAQAEQCPVPSTDLCVDQTGYVTSYTQTVTRVAGQGFDNTYNFTSTTGSATVIVHNSGCAEGQVTLNGTDLLGPLDLVTKGACFTGDVTLDTAGSNSLHVSLPASTTLTKASNCGPGGSVGGDDGHHDGDGDHDDGDHDDGDHHDDGHHGHKCQHHGHHGGKGHHYGWEHGHHHDGDDDDCDDDDDAGGHQIGGEGEGDGSVGGEGEGEGSVGGEGEGEGSVSGEGEGEGGMGGGPAGEGEGEGEGEGGAADQGCTITITVEELAQCPAPTPAPGGSGGGSGTDNSSSCASTGQAPAAFGMLALLLFLRRRRR